MTEVDPDPYQPGEGDAELGGHPVPGDGDPTRGGKDGQIGEAPSIAADEPQGGSTFPVQVPEPGPDA